MVRMREPASHADYSTRTPTWARIRHDRTYTVDVTIFEHVHSCQFCVTDAHLPRISCVSLFDQFHHPWMGTGPTALVRFTRQLGMPALHAAWRQVTGQPVPRGGPGLHHQPP